MSVRGDVGSAAGARQETVGDGVSAAALITSWVGATFPLLPAVALVIAVAGRRRSATRWLNTTAITVSAVLVVVQVVVVVAFGSLLVAGVGRYLDATASGGALDTLEEGLAGAGPAVDEGASSTVAPGTDPDQDAAFLDALDVSAGGVGSDIDGVPDEQLLGAAADVCSGLDGDADVATLTEQAAAALSVAPESASEVTANAVYTYCPQHLLALLG